MQRFSRGEHSCKLWDEFKATNHRTYVNPFIRCPYCGDPLDKYRKCYVYVQLDTLHYKEPRLRKFIEILKKYYKITDEFRNDNGSIWILNLECEGDGDKIARSLTQGHWEVKSAHDKRHDRWTLN